MPSQEADSATIPANPVVVVQGVGHLSREFMREVGSLFWFMVHTLDETVERIREGRVPFRAASFFEHCERAGVGSVPLVGLVSFFLGLTMALLTGYQLERFGTERLVPGLVAIAFTRELGPLITGIMLAARIGAAFTAELGTMKVSVTIPCRAAHARAFLPDAMSFHHCEPGGHFRELSHFTRLFQHRVRLFS